MRLIAHFVTVTLLMPLIAAAATATDTAINEAMNPLTPSLQRDLNLTLPQDESSQIQANVLSPHCQDLLAQINATAAAPTQAAHSSGMHSRMGSSGQLTQLKQQFDRECR